MKIFITGIAGFLGSQLATYFRQGYPSFEIWGMDNLSRRGAAENVYALERLGCRFIHGDLRCPSDLELVPRVGWVIDCSANPSVLAGLSGGTASLIGNNLTTTLNLLEKCRIDTAGFLLVSTSRTYSVRELSRVPIQEAATRFDFDKDAGVPVGVGPNGVSEDFSTTPPLSLYGATKLASEILGIEYSTAFGFPFRAIRCGVLAGAGQFGKIDQGIFSFWLHSHRARRSLSFIGFEGSGKQVRDCLHPRDLFALITRQLEAGSAVDKPLICNASGGMTNSMSLLELHQWCDNRFGSLSVARTPANRPNDAPWIILDSSLAARTWGWTPSIGIENILNEIAEHGAANPNWLERV